MSIYLFTSKRLGFRKWGQDDLLPMSEINSDNEVMKYFPNTISKRDTASWIEKQKEDFKNYGYCYYAVDLLQSNEFIGFIGLSYKELDTNFSPCTDIGWRLATKFQGRGLATEGARRCLDYGLQSLQLKEVVSMASEINDPSINVMQKIGLKFSNSFKHPLLKDYPKLEECVLYIIKK